MAIRVRELLVSQRKKEMVEGGSFLNAHAKPLRSRLRVAMMYARSKQSAREVFVYLAPSTVESTAEGLQRPKTSERIATPGSLYGGAIFIPGGFA